MVKNKNIYKPRYKIAYQAKSKIWAYKNSRLRRFYSIRGRWMNRCGAFRKSILVSNTIKWTVARRFIRPYIRRLKSPRGKTRYKNSFYVKQQLRNFYGKITEMKLRSIYKAHLMDTIKRNKSFFNALECRADMFFFRLRFLPTIYSCNQYVHHHGLIINTVGIQKSPHALIKVGDTISIPEHHWEAMHKYILYRIFYRAYGKTILRKRQYKLIKKKCAWLRRWRRSPLSKKKRFYFKNKYIKNRYIFPYKINLKYKKKNYNQKYSQNSKQKYIFNYKQKKTQKSKLKKKIFFDSQEEAFLNLSKKKNNKKDILSIHKGYFILFKNLSVYIKLYKYLIDFIPEMHINLTKVKYKSDMLILQAYQELYITYIKAMPFFQNLYLKYDRFMLYLYHIFKKSRSRFKNKKKIQHNLIQNLIKTETSINKNTLKAHFSLKKRIKRRPRIIILFLSYIYITKLQLLRITSNLNKDLFTIHALMKIKDIEEEISSQDKYFWQLEEIFTNRRREACELQSSLELSEELADLLWKQQIVVRKEQALLKDFFVLEIDKDLYKKELLLDTIQNYPTVNQQKFEAKKKLLQLHFIILVRKFFRNRNPRKVYYRYNKKKHKAVTTGNNLVYFLINRRYKKKRNKSIVRLRKIHWYVPNYIHFDLSSLRAILLYSPRFSEIILPFRCSLLKVYSFYKSLAL